MTEKLVSIRGAVTCQNTIESISEASVRLVKKLFFKNALNTSRVVNLAISSTPDITAFYPARAIREAGFDVPLFSCVEPNIDGSIKKCIRVMITCYSSEPVRPLYLNGARALRPDIAGKFSVALDGPSGAGKSTVAKAISKRLGVAYLDTGALYRTLGLVALRGGVDIYDEKAVCDCLKSVEVGLEYRDGVQHMFAGSEDVTGEIRTNEVSMAASAVSAYPFVREKLLELQRGAAQSNSVVLDGRDIGTVVLPRAEFKYFLTASAEIRAKRRFDELTSRGDKVEYEKILRDVITRDKNDSTRKTAPLKKAFDAVEINSDDITADEVATIIFEDITRDIK